MVLGGELVNIPNILTAIRFVLVPIFGYFLYREQYYTAIFLFTLGGITDVFDGFVARKFNMITSWGKLADPIADKLMQITALAILTMQNLIPSAVVIIVIAKEIFMGVGSILLYKNENFVVSANWYGKLATVIFYIVIVFTIVIRVTGINNAGTDLIVNILVLIAVITTLFAFFMYFITFRKITKDQV